MHFVPKVFFIYIYSKENKQIDSRVPQRRTGLYLFLNVTKSKMLGNMSMNINFFF